MAKSNHHSPYERFVCRPFAFAGAGFFCSYVIGILLMQLTRIPALSFLSSLANVLGPDSLLIGAVVGAGIAFGMVDSPLCILSAAVAGAVGYSFAGFFSAMISAYICSLLAVFVHGKTRADILLIPVVCTSGGVLVSLVLAPAISSLYALCGGLIMKTNLLPEKAMYPLSALLGAFFSVTPLSMPAVSASVTDPAVSGAAFIGCCASMVSFAIASHKQNGICSTLAHALGSPRLQMGNITRNPVILLAPLLSAALAGFVSSFFGFTCDPSLIPQALTMLSGPIAILSAVSSDWFFLLAQLIVCSVVIPAAVTIPLSRLLFGMHASKGQYMKLDL